MPKNFIDLRINTISELQVNWEASVPSTSILVELKIQIFKVYFKGECSRHLIWIDSQLLLWFSRLLQQIRLSDCPALVSISLPPQVEINAMYFILEAINYHPFASLVWILN